MTPEQEITLLFPEGRTVTVKGTAFTVKPFGFGKFPKVLKLLKDINDGGDLTGVNVSTLLVDNADVVLEFAMLALNKQRDFFDDVPLDEAIELCQAIVEVNADFFVKRLQPKLLAALSALSASVGGVLSQGSSPPATA